MFGEIHSQDAHLYGRADYDCNDEINSVRRRYNRNPDYYHYPLFHVKEKPSIEHQTEKAILFNVKNKGKFWVPKSLIRGMSKYPNDPSRWKIHKSFNRKYLSENDIANNP